MRTEFSRIVTDYGVPMRIRYFVPSGGSTVYDDDMTLTKSGNDLWVSGVYQNFGNSAADAVLREQGKILQDDTKIYLLGTVNTSGVWRIGIGGSPPTREYAWLPDGADNYDVQANTIYKCIHVRYLPTGSLYGE